MEERLTLGQLLGDELEEDFTQFDMTEAQEILSNLQEVGAIDLAHAEFLQQQTLRAADILSGYLSKLVKTVSYLETKVNSAKNKASLEYQSPSGKTTAEMRKQAGECDPQVEELGTKLARARGSKSLLQQKFDILIKEHHHYKDIATGLRKTILGQPQSTNTKQITHWGE
jgi:hypothetical protein